MYWAILHRAGFTPNMVTIQQLGGVNPRFAQQIRTVVYQSVDQTPPPSISTLEELAHEFELFAQQDREGGRLRSTSGDHNLFDSDDEALLGFLPAIQMPAAQGKSSAIDLPIQRCTLCDRDIQLGLKRGQTVISIKQCASEVMSYFSRCSQRRSSPIGWFILNQHAQ